MATPIGHSLVAASLFLGRNRSSQTDWRLLSSYILLANAPDLDFLPGILIGDPSAFHHNVSHSLLFGAFFTVALTFVAKRFLGWFPAYSFVRLVIVGFLLYCSHLLVDFVTLDNGFPYGMPLFWPFSSYHVNAPVYGLLNIIHETAPLSAHNLKAVLREILVFAPLTSYFALANRGLLGHRRRALSLLATILFGLVLVLFLRSNPYYQ